MEGGTAAGEARGGTAACRVVGTGVGMGVVVVVVFGAGAVVRGS